VTRDEDGVFTQRPEARGYGFDQRIVIAEGKIGTADRPAEQDVSDDRKL